MIADQIKQHAEDATRDELRQTIREFHRLEEQARRLRSHAQWLAAQLGEQEPTEAALDRILADCAQLIHEPVPADGPPTTDYDVLERYDADFFGQTQSQPPAGPR